MRIGVLAMQGAFAEHMNALNKIGIESILVRNETDLGAIDGLIIPGGESTAIGKLLDIFSLKDQLKDKIEKGFPVWGTCAGMIILANVISECETTHIPVMDIEVVRNGYGRQLGSFSIDAKITGMETPFPMIFIRAPYIKQVGEGVEILAKVDGKIVAARQNNILVTSFHPELTEDLRLHKYFINSINK